MSEYYPKFKVFNKKENRLATSQEIALLEETGQLFLNWEVDVSGYDNPDKGIVTAYICSDTYEIKKNI